MNASTKIVASQPDVHASMIGQADKWRGECMQLFAELEQIVEELLRSLHKTPKHGSKVSTGQFVGSAFKHLREITGSNGPFAAKGKSISVTLAELAPWFEWRAHLAHGTRTVWRGRNDNWLLAFAHRPDPEGPIRTFALTWEDAKVLKRLLSERVATLSENARSLKNSVAKPT